MNPYENGYDIAYYLGVVLNNTDRYKKVTSCRFERRAVGAERPERINVWIRDKYSSMTPAVTVDVTGLDGWASVEKVLAAINEYMEEHDVSN